MLPSSLRPLNLNNLQVFASCQHAAGHSEIVSRGFGYFSVYVKRQWRLPNKATLRGKSISRVNARVRLHVSWLRLHVVLRAARPLPLTTLPPSLVIYYRLVWASNLSFIYDKCSCGPHSKSHLAFASLLFITLQQTHMHSLQCCLKQSRTKDKGQSTRSARKLCFRVGWKALHSVQVGNHHVRCYSKIL